MNMQVGCFMELSDVGEELVDGRVYNQPTIMMI